MAPTLRVIVIVVMVLGLMNWGCHAQKKGGGEQPAGEQGEQPAGEKAAAEGQKKNSKPSPTRLSRCRGNPKPMTTFQLMTFIGTGHWYVSHISVPVPYHIPRNVQGIGIYMKQENILEWNYSPTEVEEIFAYPGGFCPKHSWDCIPKGLHISEFNCHMFFGHAAYRRKWIVVATDYTSTAAVYTDRPKQMYIFVKQPGAAPDASVISQALTNYCGTHAANPDSQFYKAFNGNGHPCFMKM